MHLLSFWVTLPLLAPIVVWQGLQTRRHAVRLPPVLEETASGELPGVTPSMRLLVVGESTAVGVGATTAEAALAPRLAGNLAQRCGCAVDWQVIGENGIRAGALAGKLREHRDLLEADVAIVLLGANDTSGLTSVRRWQRDLGEVIGLLGRAGCRRVFVAPVPPFHLFRLLPQPLRWLLGHRGLALNAARRPLGRPGAVSIIDGDFPTGSRYLATDGYHPSDLAYGTWAEQIADIIKNKKISAVVEVDSVFSPGPEDPSDR